MVHRHKTQIFAHLGVVSQVKMRTESKELNKSLAHTSQNGHKGKEGMDGFVFVCTEVN